MKVARPAFAADKMKARVSSFAGREFPMRALIACLILAAAAGAQAKGKAKGPRHAPATRSAPVETAAPASEVTSNEAAEAKPPAKSEAKPTTKTPKAKVYTFNGLDVEGKLKTPQLLYFLNRVKLELDTTGREKRSFLKELEKSSDDKGL
jgi:hypothetical protein